MTLQSLLNKARGDYELTIFWAGRDKNDIPMSRICEDEEIPDTDENIDWMDYVPDWDTIKNCRVTDFRLVANRNFDGPAIWVTITR